MIPPELQRVIEFLNEQMSKAEVLAVELRYFRTDDLTTLLPRVVGVTAKAQQAKPKPLHARLEDFIDYMAAHHGQAAVEVVNDFIDWARAEPNVTLTTEQGSEGFNWWPGLHVGGSSHWPIRIRHDARLFISFQALGNRPPVDDESKRRELMSKLNAVPGIAVPVSQLSGRPSISIAAIEDRQARLAVLNVLSWLLGTIRAWALASQVASTGSEGIDREPI